MERWARQLAEAKCESGLKKLLTFNAEASLHLGSPLSSSRAVDAYAHGNVINSRNKTVAMWSSSKLANVSYSIYYYKVFCLSAHNKLLKHLSI